MYHLISYSTVNQEGFKKSEVHHLFDTETGDWHEWDSGWKWDSGHHLGGRVMVVGFHIDRAEMSSPIEMFGDLVVIWPWLINGIWSGELSGRQNPSLMNRRGATSPSKIFWTNPHPAWLQKDLFPFFIRYNSVGFRFLVHLVWCCLLW